MDRNQLFSVFKKMIEEGISENKIRKCTSVSTKLLNILISRWGEYPMDGIQCINIGMIVGKYKYRNTLINLLQKLDSNKYFM